FGWGLSDGPIVKCPHGGQPAHRSLFRACDLGLEPEIWCCARSLTLSLSSVVFFLCTLQHLRQLGIASVVGQDQNHVRIRLSTDRRNCFPRRPALPPIRPRLQPENDRRDIARLGGSEQITGDRRIGLGHPPIELVAQTFAQCLWRAADNLGDVSWGTP